MPDEAPPNTLSSTETPAATDISTETLTGGSSGNESVVAGPWINSDGSFANNWTQHLGDGMDEPSLRDFRSVQDLARSFVHTKRLVGQKGLIPLTDRSTPEEIAEFRRQVGAPESAEGYQVAAENLPEGLSINQEITGKFREVANKHHLPAHVWKDLADTFIDVEKMRHEVGKQLTLQQVQERYSQGNAELERVWGQDKKRNIDDVRALANHPDVRIDVNSPGFNDPEIVKAFYRISKLLSNDKLVVGRQALAQGDPETEAMRIISDPTHKDHARYRGGDKDVQARVEQGLAWGEKRRREQQGF